MSFDYGEKRPDGQYERHPGISDAEARPRVRPLRAQYKHVGPSGPQHELRDLTPEEEQRFSGYGYVKFEPYPEPLQSSARGRFWTKAQLNAVNNGCGVVTKMPAHCAETYAVEPAYYGTTFCCGCGAYFNVSEFVWLDDGSVVGS